jgi:hypothetical protein
MTTFNSTAGLKRAVQQYPAEHYWKQCALDCLAWIDHERGEKANFSSRKAARAEIESYIDFTTPFNAPGRAIRTRESLEGCLLKVIDENYPKDNEDAIELRAKFLYETMAREAGQLEKHPWQPGGNSDKQTEARAQARRDFEHAAVAV